MAAVRGDDQPCASAALKRTAALTFAAQMTSLSVTPPASCVENVDDAAVVVDGEVRMMIFAMRDPCERVHERHRLVVVGELERLLDAVAGERSSRRSDATVRGELVGGEPRRAGRQRIDGERQQLR